MDNGSVNFLAVTPVQYNVIFCIGLASCCLSFFGSLSVTALVYQSAKKPAATFERIMLGICVADLLGTLANFMQPFLLPEYTRLPYAVGSQATCRMLGSLFYVFLTSSVYSAELSFFFWISVQQGQHSRTIRNNLEPWIHIFPWLIAIAVSVIALGLNTFNPSTVLGICLASCALDPKTWECVSTSWWTSVLRLTAVAVSLSSAAIGIWFLLRLHKKVKEQERRNSQYIFSDNSSHVAKRLETRRMKSTFTQALFYSFAFLNSFTAVSAAAIGKEVFHTFLGIRNPLLYFFVEVYVYAMFPLQGFLNWLVFIRPRVLRWKDACQDKSLIWCLQQTVLGRPTPTTARTQHLKCQAEVSNEKKKPSRTEQAVENGAQLELESHELIDEEKSNP